MNRIRMMYRPVITIFVIILLTAGSVVGVSSMVAASQAQTRAAQATLETMGQLSDNNDALRNQLLALDIKPVAPAASAIVGSVGADGATGATGQRGLPGFNGRDGTDGVDGKNGTNGIDGTSGQSGSAGISGSDGSGGMDGIDGTNGTDGTNGVNGTNGTNGADAEPVTSWTYPVGGVPYTCNRTTPFDPAEPTYSCAPTPPTN